MQSRRLLEEMLIQESEYMKINNNQLPLKLQESLNNGSWMELNDEYGGLLKDKYKTREFVRLFPYVGKDLFPRFFNFEAMRRINKIWLDPNSADAYKGSASEIYIPGNIEPSKTVVIAEWDPDSPIALDFRTTIPRVIYLCDVNYEIYWIEAFQTVDILIEKLVNKG
jgi:hypothetical protein